MSTGTQSADDKPLWDTVTSYLPGVAKYLGGSLFAILFAYIWQEAKLADRIPRPEGGESYRFESPKEDRCLVEYLVKNNGSRSYSKKVKLIITLDPGDSPAPEVHGVNFTVDKPPTMNPNDGTSAWELERTGLEANQYFGIQIFAKSKNWVPHAVTMRLDDTNDFDVKGRKLVTPSPWTDASLLLFFGGTGLGAAICFLATTLINDIRLQIEKKRKAVADSVLDRCETIKTDILNRCEGFKADMCTTIEQGLESLARSTQDWLEAQNLALQAGSGPDAVSGQIDDAVAAVEAVVEAKPRPDPSPPANGTVAPKLLPSPGPAEKPRSRKK